MNRKVLYLAMVATGALCVGACEVFNDLQRANRINSFEGVGGREVYQRQRLEWLNRQLGELHLVDPALRDNQKRLLQEAIDSIASDHTDEIGGDLETNRK